MYHILKEDKETDSAVFMKLKKSIKSKKERYIAKEASVEGMVEWPLGQNT